MIFNGKDVERIKTKSKKKKLLRRKDDLFRMVRIPESRDQEKIRKGEGTMIMLKKIGRSE